jgi:hypothetical protein
MAVAMFAVYMPAQLPGPGIAVRSICSSRGDRAGGERAARSNGNDVAPFAPGRIVP